MSKTKLKLCKIYMPVELHTKLHDRSLSMAISANHLAIFLISTGLSGIKACGCESPASEPFPSVRPE